MKPIQYWYLHIGYNHMSLLLAYILKLKMQFGIYTLFMMKQYIVFSFKCSLFSFEDELQMFNIIYRPYVCDYN